MPEPDGLHYNNRRFVSVTTTGNGEVGAETAFHYHQTGAVAWATYQGGGIRFGALVATVEADDRLDMRYSHVNAAGRLMTGVCRSTPERLPDGRLRLHEAWQWTSVDDSCSKSVVEEQR
jgi:hypothetical protein